MDQSLMNMVLWFAVFFGIIYFIIIRPNSKQQKERRNMLDSLRLRDKVITIGGIHGTVTKINEDTVIVKVANNVELEFIRPAIQSIENRDYKEDTRSKKAKKVKDEPEKVVEADDAPSEYQDDNQLR